jgi:CheY-like chemotaxis protein
MQTLFNPFKQAQRLAGGTGLGLFSLAKRVEALSRQYGVRRRPDGCQGSVFWFTIPYRPDQLSAAVVHAEIQKRSAATSEVDSEGDSRHHSFLPFRITTSCLDVHTIGSLPPQSVLVVDDAPLIVKMTGMLLSRKGHTVESAVNGVAAVEKLVQGYERKAETSGALPGEVPYDVVLMDLQMPVLDGLEAIRRLRAWETRAEAAHRGAPPDSAARSSPPKTAGFDPVIPYHKPYHQLVIALSANSDEETRLEALEAGADAFMAKPFTYENFLEVMEHRLEN